MIRKVFSKLKWADNNLVVGLFKKLYFNIIKVNRFIIWEWDLRGEVANPFVPPEGFTFKVIGCGEIEKYLANTKGLPREFYIGEIYGLKNCVVALKENRIAYICWIYVAGDKNRFFDIQEKEAHLDYSFTFPEYRGLKLPIHSNYAAAEWLKQKGISRILAAAHEGTKYMIRSMGKIKGHNQVGTLTHWFIYRPKFKG